jgi:8-hydroxy-5-deazaflavin:NADPH oxidoreductase
MRVGIVGAGHIGANIANRLSVAGHDITVSFTHDPNHLADLAKRIGARAADPRVSAKSEVVVLSVPWGAIGTALEQAGSLGGRIVIDTTNQFAGAGGADLAGRTAARMPGARYTKSFNTLTASFQAEAADRSGDERVVQWIAGDEPAAKETVARLIEDAGYVPIDLGGLDGCQVMEAPRRPGAVYDEEYRRPDALAVVKAVGAGKPIPPTPRY